MNLRTKLFIPLIVLLALFFSYAKWQWLPQFTDLVEQQNQEHLRTHLHSVAESLVPLMLEEQLANVHATLDSLLESNPNWKRVHLTDKDDQLLYPVIESPITVNSPTELLMKYPITVHTRNIGTLVVHLDISEDIQQIRNLEQNFTTVLIIVVLVISVSIVFLIETIVSRPVRNLAKASKLVAQGNYGVGLPHSNANDEVGNLVNSFESMRTSLDQFKTQVETEIEQHKQTAHELSKQKERFAYHASHDSLTGLINRREFENRLNNAIDRARTDNKEHTILFIDLDRFKIVNDSCGHLAGDELLKQVSTLIQQKIRSGDSLARLGGDEFAILLEFCPLENARVFVESLHKEIQEYRFSWGDQIFRIGASIGVAAVTKDITKVEDILSIADSACYTAKGQGRNRYHFYQMNSNDVEKQKDEANSLSRIIKALEENQFVLFAQPIVPVTNDKEKYHSFEVLVRMRGEEDKLIMPGCFIPVAERYNLMSKLDRWVIKHAFAALSNYNSSNTNDDISLSINLSGESMSDSGLLSYISEHLNRYNVEARQLCFEITETDAISELTNASLLIRELRTLGCKFALDDFGSGFSSFAYLKNLSVDFLKIDGVFVRDILEEPANLAMIKSIHEIGKVFGIETIAEFVENKDILQKLQEVGVDYAQGYGIAHPAPLADLLKQNDSGIAGVRGT